MTGRAAGSNSRAANEHHKLCNAILLRLSLRKTPGLPQAGLGELAALLGGKSAARGARLGDGAGLARGRL